jgi:Leucine-rich repeat (LRR) protein
MTGEMPRNAKSPTGAELDAGKQGDLRSAEPSLQEEAQKAPESAWLFALLKTASLYLVAVGAYFGTAAGLAKVWQRLIGTEGEPIGLDTYTLAAILALPLLFALMLNVRPALRRRMEREMRPRGIGDPRYFTTAPRSTDIFNFYSAGYQQFLEWAGHPKAPLLHLSGLSGSGKSSLLSAFLKPQLAAQSGTKSLLIVVRSYSDPLLAMKQCLLRELWKRKPRDYDGVSPLEALRRAAGQLPSDERLIVAFDQFEEFFLVRTESHPPANARPGAGASEADVSTLRDFFARFCEDPPSRTAILLSYRDDQKAVLGPLCLPKRNEGQNHMTVEPLDFAVAVQFLDSCPGLSVPNERMKRVLREAMQYEGGRVTMRPIVANLLGIILRQMSDHPDLWTRTGDLLRGYVRDTLGTETREERSRILRSLMTDFPSARPRTVEALADGTKLEKTFLERELERFRHDGLLRQLDSAGDDQLQSLWQISHDFIATLVDRVLAETERTTWRAIRPWVAPVTLLLAFGLAFVWPWVDKRVTIEALANAGFTWSEGNGAIEAATDSARAHERLDAFMPLFRRLRPRILTLHSCSFQNLDGFEGLNALERLNLSNCRELVSIDGLKHLVSLKDLELSSCDAVETFDVLEQLSNLKRLNLSYCPIETVKCIEPLLALEELDVSDCPKLRSVDDLEGLTHLRRLNLGSCYRLRSIKGLARLSSLHELDLSGCGALVENVDDLKNLVRLERLNMSNCGLLRSVDGLNHLVSLQHLDLNSCYSLKKIDAFKGAASLRELDLSGCKAVQSGGVLSSLKNLERLTLHGCDALQNVDGLNGLPNLQELNLSECRALDNVNGLRGLARLYELNLNTCPRLSSIDGLRGLTNLERLDLSTCSLLQSVDALSGLANLQELDLSNCRALHDFDGIKGLKRLQTLTVSTTTNVESLEGLAAALPATTISRADESIVKRRKRSGHPEPGL